MKYSKEEAIKIANCFINEVNELEKKYHMIFNSDTSDVYLSFKTIEKNKVWDTISLGWNGDGTGIKVIEEVKMKEKIREQALNKLTDEERKVLGLL
jgi:hypothetical protein